MMEEPHGDHRNPLGRPSLIFKVAIINNLFDSGRMSEIIL